MTTKNKIAAMILCITVIMGFMAVPIASASMEGAGIGAGIGVAVGGAPGAAIGAGIGVAATEITEENLEDAWDWTKEAASDTWGFLTSGDKEEDVISFSEFKGGLEAPKAEGLAPSLTRASNARDFIRNVLNFALTFLGIVALAIVIYGGFLYVTSAGNEEQSGKGKKAVTYAAIGIIIILGSFALVNTLLTLGGGEGDKAGGAGKTGEEVIRGVSEEGSNIGQQSIYGLTASAISSSLNEFLGAYKRLIAVKTIVEQIKKIPSATTFASQRNFVNEVKIALNSIKNNTDALSETHEAARKLLDGWIADKNGLIAAKEAAGTTTPIEDGKDLAKDFTTQIDTEEDCDLQATTKDNCNLLTTAKNDFKTVIGQIINDPPKNTSSDLPPVKPSLGCVYPKADCQEGKLIMVRRILKTIAENTSASELITKRGFATEKEMKRAFSGIDPTMTVGMILDTAIKGLNTANTDVDSDSGVTTETVKKIVQSFDRLFIVVKNIEFVFVKIRATAREGNAPFIVELNGLESRDPTGITITDDKYEWDPDGDGAKDIQQTDKVTCDSNQKTNPPTNSLTGPIISCTYSKPGAYVVSLKIPSADVTQVATGQAFLTITVKPPLAKISLTAKIAGMTEPVYLRRYTETGEIEDKNEFQITAQEAKNPGVEFNASKSEASDGSALQSFEWSFGDNSGIEKTQIVKHMYKNTGRYPLKLEVTDKGGRKDKKLVNVIVSSIAARTSLKNPIAEPDELIEVDGSLSRSDTGQISSYDWKITQAKENNEISENKNLITSTDFVDLVGTANSPTLRVKFKRSGIYKITLTVSSGTETAQSEETIYVKSHKPRASFEIIPDPSKPNTVVLDASTSFDPDRDELIYAWSVFDEYGTELEEKGKFESAGGTPLKGKDAKKVSLRFLKTGKYKIRLILQDDLPQEGGLQQTDIKDKTIEIASIVEAKWDPTMQSAAILKPGEGATVIFSGATASASRIQIDYGDGQTEEKEVTTPPGQENRFNFIHIYQEAKSEPYIATLKASSDQGNGENAIKKRVYVSSGNSPMAVIKVYKDDVLMELPEPSYENAEPALETIRKKLLAFDANDSITSKGESRSDKYLEYSWDFGDGSKATGAKANHSYEYASPEDKPFAATLIVRERDCNAEGEKICESRATIPISVVSKKPLVNTLSYEKKTSGMTAPIDVELTAEGALDPDGRITNYQFWYYDPADKEKKMSVVDTQVDRATLTVETSGAEGEEREYIFCVSVTDNENATSECSELFGESELPHLRVKNGPNKAPTASLSVNRSVVKVGEPVTFTSSSKDEDGSIKGYVWDLDGDGFQNDNPGELSTVTHTYEKKSPKSGYRVKLKVLDDKGAAGFSKEVPVIVEAKSQDPKPAFWYITDTEAPRRVKFFDKSEADTQSGARLTKWKWDFDTAHETGCEDAANRPAYCDNNKTNDINSEDQNPIYDFPASGKFQVKLMVEDSDGNTAETTGTVDVTGGAALSGGTGGAETPAANLLKAELTGVTSGGIRPVFEQQRGCGPNPGGSLDACKIKVLHMPASACAENITLFWGDSRGNIASYKIETDLSFDSNGDGEPGNDDIEKLPGSICNVVDTRMDAENCINTTYKRYGKTTNPEGPGRQKARLIALDAGGNRVADFLNVVFDVGPNTPASTACAISTLGGSLFNKLGTQNTILLSLTAGVILILTIFGAVNLLHRGKKREI